mmetsp:Transcript_11146/g.18211  ORF Transcript_11146/g.18211 Transcript_11146/m.18211 type:complete len:387 (+) Transcript_11146:138-1298(+)|eukprot:CAMPEP_0184660416 /NCGR_PEP_ID=MMETSP0308-20130426/33799_1 /TAXON_ID=38269 /ORGANISM="Gloeochaete witrockiana, Strain SAG 46.84" /LENGTH=386 /DNA_ID=CAMNT_0027100979 /DNA_START=29 /DNA_END=1189 /DNA_ORIENTATION=+
MASSKEIVGRAPYEWKNEIVGYGGHVPRCPPWRVRGQAKALRKNRIKPVFRLNDDRQSSERKSLMEISKPLSAPARLQGSQDFIPGYTGVVARMKEVVGKTYGASAEEAFEVTRSIKAAPTETFSKLPETFRRHKQAIARQQDLAPFFTGSPVENGRIPGYAGHVPRVMNAIGLSFGETTRVLQKGLLPSEASEDPYAPDGFSVSIWNENAKRMQSQSQPLTGHDSPDTFPPGYGGHIPGAMEQTGSDVKEYVRDYVSQRMLQTDVRRSSPGFSNGLPISPHHKPVDFIPDPRPPHYENQHVPGYTGKTTGSQYFIGSTYYSATALARSGKTPADSGGLHKTMMAERAPVGFMDHIRGYQGHVPRAIAKDLYGQTQTRRSTVTMSA